MKLDRDKNYKVTHTLMTDGEMLGIFRTDLAWGEDRWYLVFEWETNHDGEWESLRREIDPALLVPAGTASLLIECPLDISGDLPLLTRIREARGF